MTNADKLFYIMTVRTYFNLDLTVVLFYVLYIFICDIFLIVLCTDRLTDGTSPLPERLGREGPPRGRTHLRLDRSLPLAPCYSIFRLNTVTCECFPPLSLSYLFS